MKLYSVDFDCPRCGNVHGVIGGLVGSLRIENGPDRAGTVAELYEGRELPAVLVRLLDDLVECEILGGYIRMDDPTRVHLTPRSGT